MPSALERAILPSHQRRTLDELTEELDLRAGDAAAKRSAFWIMLVLSAVIASAGVLTNSTATVIGAMIIAPLSTPIMGVALGIAKQDRATTRGSARTVILGVVVVIAIGAVFSLVLPSSYALLSNSQISGRTSPNLLDLVAAVATGFAGAIALARRDVAAVLPGVAIAISLVPPLAVVGVCLGQGSLSLAAGALLLFVSNFLALVLAGAIVYATLGFTAEGIGAKAGRRRRANLAVAGLLVVVAIPLVATSVGDLLVTLWTGRVETAAEEWVSGTPGAQVTGVDVAGTTAIVQVRSPVALPSADSLVASLDGQIPSGITIVVTTSRGERIEAGTVGG